MPLVHTPCLVHLHGVKLNEVLNSKIDEVIKAASSHAGFHATAKSKAIKIILIDWDFIVTVILNVCNRELGACKSRPASSHRLVLFVCVGTT